MYTRQHHIFEGKNDRSQLELVIFGGGYQVDTTSKNILEANNPNPNPNTDKMPPKYFGGHPPKDHHP